MILPNDELACLPAAWEAVLRHVRDAIRDHWRDWSAIDLSLLLSSGNGDRIDPVEALVRVLDHIAHSVAKPGSLGSSAFLALSAIAQSHQGAREAIGAAWLTVIGEKEAECSNN